MGNSGYCFGKSEKLCDFLCSFASSLKGDSWSNWYLMEQCMETLFIYAPSTLPILHLPWMLPPHIMKNTVITLTSNFIFLITLRHFHGDSSLPGTYTDSLRFTWILSYSHCFMDCWFGKRVRSLGFSVLSFHRHTNSLLWHNHICHANLCISLIFFLQCYLHTDGDFQAISKSIKYFE